jgi:hypothetical protein
MVTQYNNTLNLHPRLHFVGRSSAITSLYGKRLGREFCILETGYILGLLRQQASTIGIILTFSPLPDAYQQPDLHLNPDDTHFSCEISTDADQSLPDVHATISYPQCFVYLKSQESVDNDEWFIYEHQHHRLIPYDILTRNPSRRSQPLIFDDDYEQTRLIFHDCQCVLFFIGEETDRLNTGVLAHLLMENGIDMNIGMCPIGTSKSLPHDINKVLGDISLHQRWSESNKKILHTLLIGKVSDQKKYERATSSIPSLKDYRETLTKFLSEKLPPYLIPAYFTTVSSFPLGSNGKIDRNSLPDVSSSILNSIQKTYKPPISEIEKTVASLWQELLFRKSLTFNRKIHEMSATTNETIPSIFAGNLISLDSTKDMNTCSVSMVDNFYSLGGDSLLLIQIYRQYQTLFGFDNDQLPIRLFFEQNTIAEHAKLLKTIKIDNKRRQQWHSLNIREGKISTVITYNRK